MNLITFYEWQLGGLSIAQILLSTLGANILRLRDEIEFLEHENTAILHVDMMDNNFVSNTVPGPSQIGAMKETSKMMFDAHMMIDYPKGHLDDAIATGAEIISVHYESTPHIHNIIQRIRRAGRRAGVVLSPGTPEPVLEYLLDDIDYVLIITTNPRTPGQTFIGKSLEKVASLKRMISSRPTWVGADGGVDNVIAKQMAGAGAKLTVVGGYFSGGNPNERYSILREAAKQKLRQGYGTISITPQEQRGWYKDEKI